MPLPGSRVGDGRVVRVTSEEQDEHVDGDGDEDDVVDKAAPEKKSMNVLFG